MKKMIGFIGIIAIILSMTLMAFAGSITEDLMNYDGAKIFFAEIVSYDTDGETMKLSYSATRKVKGDVVIGEIEEAYRPGFVGDFAAEVGKEYLFIYLDENNDTYIFEVTSTDTATLKLKNVTGDMWERLEKNLNDGKYEETEQERVERLGLAENLIADADTSIPNEETGKTHYLIYSIVAAAFLVSAFVIIRKKRG